MLLHVDVVRRLCRAPISVCLPVGTRPIRRLCRFASAQRLRVAGPVGNGVVSATAPVDCAPERSRCDRRERCGRFGVRAVRTIRTRRRRSKVPPNVHLAPSFRCGRGSCPRSVRRLPGRLQTAVVNWRHDLGSPSVRTHSSAICDTARRVPESLPAGKNGVVSDRRKGVAHRVPNSLPKSRHICACTSYVFLAGPVSIDVCGIFRPDH